MVHPILGALLVYIAGFSFVGSVRTPLKNKDRLADQDEVVKIGIENELSLKCPEGSEIRKKENRLNSLSQRSIIKSSNKKDEGTYFCLSSNGTILHQFQVEIGSPPYILSDLPSEITTARSQSIEITCKTNGFVESVVLEAVNVDEAPSQMASVLMRKKDTGYVANICPKVNQDIFCLALNPFGITRRKIATIRLTGNAMIRTDLDVACDDQKLGLHHGIRQHNAEGLKVKASELEDALTKIQKLENEIKTSDPGSQLQAFQASLQASLESNTVSPNINDTIATIKKQQIKAENRMEKEMKDLRGKVNNAIVEEKVDMTDLEVEASAEKASLLHAVDQGAEKVAESVEDLVSMSEVLNNTAKINAEKASQMEELVDEAVEVDEDINVNKKKVEEQANKNALATDQLKIATQQLKEKEKRLETMANEIFDKANEQMEREKVIDAKLKLAEEVGRNSSNIEKGLIEKGNATLNSISLEKEKSLKEIKTAILSEKQKQKLIIKDLNVELQQLKVMAKNITSERSKLNQKHKLEHEKELTKTKLSELNVEAVIAKNSIDADVEAAKAVKENVTKIALNVSNQSKNTLTKIDEAKDVIFEKENKVLEMMAKIEREKKNQSVIQKSLDKKLDEISAMENRLQESNKKDIDERKIEVIKLEKKEKEVEQKEDKLIKIKDKIDDNKNMEAKKDDVINAKLKNIENLQETLQKTLVNTTTSLSKIDELKSELEKSVKSVDEKQKEMEGTKQELQAAVSKIEEVGNKMIEKQSMLKEKEVEALSKVAEIQEKETKLAKVLDKTSQGLELKEERKNAEVLNLVKKKTEIDAKEKALNEKEKQQMKQTLLVDKLLNKTAMILDEKVKSVALEAKNMIEKDKKNVITENKGGNTTIAPSINTSPTKQSLNQPVAINTNTEVSIEVHMPVNSSKLGVNSLNATEEKSIISVGLNLRLPNPVDKNRSNSSQTTLRPFLLKNDTQHDLLFNKEKSIDSKLNNIENLQKETISNTSSLAAKMDLLQSEILSNHSDRNKNLNRNSSVSDVEENSTTPKPIIEKNSSSIAATIKVTKENETHMVFVGSATEIASTENKPTPNSNGIVTETPASETPENGQEFITLPPTEGNLTTLEHMVFVGPEEGSVVTDIDKSGAEKTSTSSVSDTKPSKDEKMVFVGPVQNFISENLTNLNETIVTQIGDDKNGSIFTETIAIVGDQPKQKPPNYEFSSNGDALETPEYLKSQYNDSGAAVLSNGFDEQEQSDRKKSHIGSAGWVFFGLFICLLCIGLVVVAVVVARRRHSKKMKSLEEQEAAAFSTNRLTPLNSEESPAMMYQDPKHGEKMYGFSAGYVDEISLMPHEESSDPELGRIKKTRSNDVG